MQVNYNGYILMQTNYDYHYMIFDEEGRRVLYCPCDRRITEDTAKNIKFINTPQDVIDKLLEAE